MKLILCTYIAGNKNIIIELTILFKQTLNRFLCVILGGLAAEHLLFGYSELLHSDVQKVTCCL